jgi:non-heme chloroperoxidase
VQNAVLVGFSMGGGEVARYLSHAHSGRVSKAMLVSSVTPYLLQTPDNPEGVDPSVFQDIAHKIRADRPAFMKDFGAKFYGRTMVKHTVSAEVLEWTQSLAMQGSLRATLAAALAWSSTDFRDDLERISLPVRIIHGTGDVTVPIDRSARRAAQLLPNATVSEYDGEPHGLFMTAADRFNDELLQFCAS